MPRLNAELAGTSTEWASVKAAGLDIGEKDDCVVVALALAARIPYEEAHALCKNAGREDGKAMNDQKWIKLFKTMMKLKGVPLQDFISQYPKPHCDVLKGVTTHHPNRFNKIWKNGKRYLFLTKDHLAYVEDGAVMDWSRKNAMRVKKVFEVTEK